MVVSQVREMNAGLQEDYGEISCATPTCAARNTRSLILYPTFWQSMTVPGSLSGIGAWYRAS